MRKLSRGLKTISIMFLLAALLLPALSGCTGETPTAAPTPAPAPANTSSTVLTIAKDTQTVTYTMDALKKLALASGWAGQMSSTGTITGPFQYKGVALSELLKSVGGITENNAVRVSAKDGYAMTLSYKQLTEGNFTTIDSATGKEAAAQGKPLVFIAYEEDGKPLNDQMGPLRLGIMTSQNQVTEGHWWVKWAQKIEIIATQKPWTLKLEGAIVENIDPATFESCSAIGCHGAKWTDEQARVWEGVPLWYFAGRVDDVKDTHKGDAYSDALADKGYEIQVIASDNYTVKFTSAETKRNNGLIVAFKRDGVPLPENQWPLRLVGAGLDKQRMAGKIATIKLALTPAAAATPTAAPGPAVLTVIKGTQTKTYSLAELKALAPTEGFAGTKNKAGVIAGPSPYKGVALTTLLSAVGGLADGNSVKFTAKDGYTKTLTYAQIMQGTFTTYDATGNAVNPEMKPAVFLAYEADNKALDDSTGPVQLAVMTCKNQVTDGSNFVKQTEKIEVITP